MVKFATFTGKRWPVLGRRLVEDFPFIEADVIYGVRNVRKRCVLLLYDVQSIPVFSLVVFGELFRIYDWLQYYFLLNFVYNSITSIKQTILFFGLKIHVMYKINLNKLIETIYTS